ncbi:MAG TPA: polymer-forming cytoskeletal protein [Usitatibacter sp.]|jgi:cytoskeletal protein CcmA (bactofilin family)|nr:polymer-forming cytoskeletal protein [Usitatibacter sp.]
MKYGEGIFNRTRDTRLQPPAQPVAANAPSLGPTPAHPAPRPAPAVPAANAEPAPRAEEAGGSKLIVGPNIKLKGVEIHDCDTLVVEGRVEATMVSRSIQIAEHGAFEGKVDVDIAEIRGTFNGEMTARKKLVIHASGRVGGKIRYGKMLVQEGGEMTGDIAALHEGPVMLAKG